MRIEENVPLATLTTFRTGGLARFLLTLESKREVPEAFQFAARHRLPFIPIGEGSNLLSPDEGLNAVLARYQPHHIEATEAGGIVAVAADAGVLWDELVLYAVTHGWWGIENLSAIPGTVGAAVVQNIGAYGAMVGNSIFTVEAYDSTEQSFKTFTRAACRFGYRTSIFKEAPDRYFITRVTFTLSKIGIPNTTYRDLTLYFEDDSSEPTLEEMRDAVCEIRSQKFPPLTDFGTAGSFFLNPIFTEQRVKVITEKYPDIPVYHLPEGGVKIPLAWIFDRVLQAKGRRIGGAFIWDKQPLVVAAEKSATTDDILMLAKNVAKDFFNATSIKIFPEVRLFNDDIKHFS